ncbi:MAG: YihA family ribosome biogenesis GTP-binding protein [Clostridia bacterium]|nr:YihA family ribosome biogenesis GTP-binding protein [Clostridia bacterium]
MELSMRFGPLNLHNTDLILTAGLPSQLIRTGLPQIAFAGRSNVGKSSLVNSLLGRKKLARVSGEPGKTVTVNCYRVDKKLILTDLPGYGFAKRSKESVAKWSSLTESYFRDNEALRMVLQLVDSRVGVTEDDRMMLRYLEHYRVPYLVVATKADKLNRTELAESSARLMAEPSFRPGTEVILYSSTTHQGRDALWARMIEAAGLSGKD